MESQAASKTTAQPTAVAYRSALGVMPFMAYNCNVCGKPGMAEYETALEKDISWMAKILCHNRCADFMAMKQRQRRRVDAALDWLARVELKRGDVDTAKERTRTCLVNVTKAYCYAVCRYYGKPLAWEPFIVEKIMATPDKWSTVLNMFEYATKNRK